MISASLFGDRELVARIAGMADTVKPDIDRTMMRLGFQLQANVQRDYLTGQVLKVRTGRLRSSITQGAKDSRSHFESTPTSATAVVGTNVSYGKVWEITGRPATTIVPIKAKALRFEIGGEVLFRKSVRQPAMPPRPYLKPALQAFRPFAAQQLQGTLADAARKALKS